MLDLAAVRVGMFLRSWSHFQIFNVGLDPHLESLDKSLEGLEYFESISIIKHLLSGSAYKLPFKIIRLI